MNTRIVKTELVLMSPTNPRETFSQSSIEELASSIKKHGLLHPIVVRPITIGTATDHDYLQKNQVESSDLQIIHMGNGASHFYEVAAGERRFRALKYLGRTEIPVNIKELTDEEFMEVQFIENIERKDVHPLEEAKAFKYLMDVRRGKNRKYSIKNLADDLGRTPKFISKRLKLNELGKTAREYLIKGYMNISQALELVGLPEDVQDYVLDWCSDTYEADGEKQVAVWSSSGLRNRIKERLMKIEDAFFDTDDSDLTAAPACNKCEYNTSCQNLLFSDMDPQGGNCTNRKCFEEKTLAWKKKLVDDFRKKHPEGKLILIGSHWTGMASDVESFIESKQVLRLDKEDVNMDKKCPKGFSKCLIIPSAWGDNEHRFKIVNVSNELIAEQEAEIKENEESKEIDNKSDSSPEFRKAMQEYREATWTWERERRSYKTSEYEKKLTDKLGEYSFKEHPEVLMLAAANGFISCGHEEENLIDYVLEKQPNVLDNYKGKIERSKSAREIIENDIDFEDFILLVDKKIILQAFFIELIKEYTDYSNVDLKAKAFKEIGIDEKKIKAKAEKEFAKNNPEPIKPRIEDFETVGV